MLYIILIFGTAACFLIDAAAGIVALVSLLLMTAISLYFTRWRYREIEKLSQYLSRLAGGEYALDIEANEEGELGILKSEIYKATVTLREQAELLKKDKSFLSDSISDISHQLKTPITSMYVMTDLLRDESLPPDKRLEFTNNIGTQLERLQWLVTSLLKLSKIDAGAIVFKKESVNVKALVHKAVEPLLIPIEAKEQTLEINGDEDAKFIGDFNWSAEALTNIIKNCMEHSPVGGRLLIEFSESPFFTSIRITDNGEGIDKNDLPHIFKRFYMGRNSHDDSIGIGLAMSKTIFENQNGIIEAASEKSKGTQFSVKIYKTVI